MAIHTLVVDNNPVLLKAISTILEQEGCLVKTAGTGLEALEIVETFTPDIVFTDLIMPQVSGEQLCRILRNTKKHKHVYIVVLSAIVLEDRERILSEVECDICIAKGSLQEIREHVREALISYKAWTKGRSRPRQAGGRPRIPDGLQASDVTSELLSEQKHLVTILTNLEEGILEVSEQGKIFSLNRAALGILSCREEELVGKYLPDCLDWGDHHEPIRGWTEEYLIARKVGRYDIGESVPLVYKKKILTGSFLAVHDSNKKFFGLCILRDISRQYIAEKQNKELDNAIRFAKKMDSLSCMAGGVAHDFNNLLTVICGNLEILALPVRKEGRHKEMAVLEQAQTAAQVAVDLTRQISCFSNFGIVRRERVSALSLIRKAVEGFLATRSHGCDLQINCEDFPLYVDEDEICLAITNVLQNGMEACPLLDMTVSVSLAVITRAQLVRGQYIVAGKYLRIDIADQGKGIAEDHMLKIFDPYFSTKQRGAIKGMGLGLAVVYAVMRNHGGHVVVDSTYGNGTVVSLYLPVRKSDAATDFLPQLPVEKEKQRIYLLDPDQQMQEIGEIMIQHLGFQGHGAKDRQDLMEKLELFIRDNPQAVPLVLLDLFDANSESAVKTCALIHKINPAIPVVAMSGTILDPIMERCEEYGFAGTLSKPYTIDSLKHAIVSCLPDR